MSLDTIRVDGVSKHFKLYHERPQTLKERMISFRRARYEEFWALKDVNLDIAPGETVGLVGPNGSGKSTLMKLIAGILRPDKGSIVTRGRIASLLELGAGFHPDLTGRENVFMNASILGLTRKETTRYFDQIVEFAELEQFIDMQVKHYSSGMYVRLGFAVAVHVEPELLLVDEVLSVGDEAFQRKCLDRIRTFQKEGRTIVFVTHAVDLVRVICTRATFLHHGIQVADGAPNDVVREYRKTVHGEAHLEAAPFEERGTREIVIENVEIRDTSGQKRQMFTTGEDLVLSIDMYAPAPVEDPVVGCTLYDDKDQEVFGTNTSLRMMDLGTLNGKSRATFTFRGLPLGTGTYSLTVGIHSRDERTAYHWQEKAYRFQCVSIGSDAGYLRLPIDIEMEQL